MKKTLAALAVLGAFAGSAAAADVTLYGVIDYGMNYQHVDGDAPHTDADDSFTMKSGQNSGSRFGLKGEEDLGNGYKVGFVLENGFNADDGTMDNDGRLFGREAQLYVQGNFGKLGFGRVGQFASALGTYGLLGQTSPFSAGWGSFTGQKFVQAAAHGRFDNTVTYQTPSFAGFQVAAQYSFQQDSKKEGVGDEGKPSTNRYYALAATYKAQNLYLVGIVDSINYGSVQTTKSAGDPELDDSLTFTLGGNYDFGVAKVYAVAQYFDNALSVGQSSNIGANNAISAGTDVFVNGAEGWDIALGIGVPCFGGTAKAHVGYLSAEDTEDSDTTLDRWNVSVGYDYNLSKRTSVYTAATYFSDSIDYSKKQTVEGKRYDRDPSAVEFMFGIIHKF